MKTCNQINIAATEILLGGFAPVETVKFDDGLELRVHYFNLSAFGPLIFGIQTNESNPNVYLLSSVEDVASTITGSRSYQIIVFLGKRSDFLEAAADEERGKPTACPGCLDGGDSQGHFLCQQPSYAAERLYKAGLIYPVLNGEFGSGWNWE